MNPKVNIVVVVDVIGALSDGTLRNGNLCMIDDGSLQSTGQGTPELVTVVKPGQVVTWSALAVDLQTPVEIKSITFLGPDGDGGHEAEQTPPATQAPPAAQAPCTRPPCSTARTGTPPSGTTPSWTCGAAWCRIWRRAWPTSTASKCRCTRASSARCTSSRPR